MDRSPRRHGFVWVGVAMGALLLPACSDLSSSPAQTRGDGSSNVHSAAESSALALRTRSPSTVGSGVVPASHLFAPPPLPLVESAIGVGEPLLLEREPIVRMVPDRDAAFPSSHAPRRLPQIDPGKILDIDRAADGEPCQETDSRVSNEVAADLSQLPPPPDVDEQLDAATDPPGDLDRSLNNPSSAQETAALRRLPEVDGLPAASETDQSQGAASDILGALRRLPSAATESDGAVGQVEAAETARRGDDSFPEERGGVETVSPPPDWPQSDDSSAMQPIEQLPSPSDTAATTTLPTLDAPTAEVPAIEGDAVAAPPLSGEAPEQRGDADAETAPSDDDASDLSGPQPVPPGEEPATLTAPELNATGPVEDELRPLPPVVEETGEQAEHARQLSPPLFAAEGDLCPPSDEVGSQSEFQLPDESSVSSRVGGSDPAPAGGSTSVPVDSPRSEPAPAELRAGPPTDRAAAPRAWSPVAVPIAPPAPAGAVLVKAHDVTFDVITRRVGTLSRRAEDLASRGAYFAARAEMIKALRIITQALDAQLGVRTHSEALGHAMRTLQEASDFSPRGSRLESELNLAQVVSGHRTTVLKDEHLERLTPLSAQQRYLEYSQEQFALAGGNLPAASYALYGLARIYTVMDHAKLETQTLCLPTALTLHQAALLVDAANVKAANELGVLLARFGQWEDARRVLQHALSLRHEPEIWHNIAVVHQRLGEAELAQQAYQQYELMAARQPGDHRLGRADSVQWVDSKTFSQVAPASMP